MSKSGIIKPTPIRRRPISNIKKCRTTEITLRDDQAMGHVIDRLDKLQDSIDALRAMLLQDSRNDSLIEEQMDGLRLKE